MRPARPLALTLLAALVAAPCLALPSVAEAQRVVVRRGTTRHEVVRRDRDREPSRSLTLAVGVLDFDGAAGTDDENFPMAALRADWRLAHWLRSEVSVSYALGELDAPAGSGLDDRDTHLLNATVGLNALLPVPVLRPYVGIAGGLSGRFDSDDGADFVRPSVAVPVGLRIPLTSRIGLRAEVRWRFDQQEGSGDAAVHREQTVGVAFGF